MRHGLHVYYTDISAMIQSHVYLLVVPESMGAYHRLDGEEDYSHWHLVES